MLYYKNNRWHISNEKVRYIQDDKEEERPIGVEGKEWWIYFAKIWGDTKIIEFIKLAVTDIQIARLEKVNNLNIPDGFSILVSEYVINGVFPDEIDSKLRNLQLEELNQQQGIDISEREIGEIILGMQVSDIEIELLMMKGCM